MNNKIGTSDEPEKPSEKLSSDQTIPQNQDPKIDRTPTLMSKSSRTPFPNRLRSNKQSEHLDKILEVFK